MNRLNAIKSIRAKLTNNQVSIGSWIQIPHPSIAEIMGEAGYDWVTVDMEHGNISIHQLPDIFRALELGGTLPMVRVAQGFSKDCKLALDAGAGGIICPMVESKKQLIELKEYSCWPPSGKRGVAFSRANLFGKHFDKYVQEAQNPLLIGMIESKDSLKNLEEILSAKIVDAVLIGPYDLSASLGINGQFENTKFVDAVKKIINMSKSYKTAVGIHVVDPSINEVKNKVDEGYQFLAYSLDSVMLRAKAEEIFSDSNSWNELSR